MSHDRDPMAGDAGIPRTIDWYVESFPRVAMQFLSRLRSEPGYADAQPGRWTIVSTTLAFYDRPGIAPSGWRESLIKMLDACDIRNLARSALAFHDEALCVWICKQMPGGTDLLEEALRIAERIDTPMARRILGTSLDPRDHPDWGMKEPGELRFVEVSGPAVTDLIDKLPKPGVHTPHHGKTDLVCHPENGERVVWLDPEWMAIVGAPLTGPIPSGYYLIKSKKMVGISELRDGLTGDEADELACRDAAAKGPHPAHYWNDGNESRFLCRPPEPEGPVGAHTMRDRAGFSSGRALDAELVKAQEPAEEPCEDESPHLSHAYPFGGAEYRCPGQ